MGKPVDLVQGTLDLLILKAIGPAPLHGWAIAQRINQLSQDVLRVQQGSLYPALQRLERAGWISAEWGASENNRRARFYSLTKAGRRHLEREQAGWERLSERDCAACCEPRNGHARSDPNRGGAARLVPASLFGRRGRRRNCAFISNARSMRISRQG